MDPVISVVILGAVIAGFVQGLTGFAFSLVAVSIWAWGVEPALARAPPRRGSPDPRHSGILTRHCDQVPLLSW